MKFQYFPTCFSSIYSLLLNKPTFEPSVTAGRFYAVINICIRFWRDCFEKEYIEYFESVIFWRLSLS